MNTRLWASAGLAPEGVPGSTLCADSGLGTQDDGSNCGDLFRGVHATAVDIDEHHLEVRMINADSATEPRQVSAYLRRWLNFTDAPCARSRSRSTAESSGACSLGRSVDMPRPVIECVIAIAAGTLATGALTSCSGPQTRVVPVRQADTRWSKPYAEERIEAIPPLRWRLRLWQVVDVDCIGHHQAGRKRLRAVYRNFSCTITVVKPSYDCPSNGRYECVEGFQSTVTMRTLHVISAKKYALYRP